LGLSPNCALNCNTFLCYSLTKCSKAEAMQVKHSDCDILYQWRRSTKSLTSSISRWNCLSHVRYSYTTRNNKVRTITTVIIIISSSSLFALQFSSNKTPIQGLPKYIHQPFQLVLVWRIWMHKACPL